MLHALVKGALSRLRGAEPNQVAKLLVVINGRSRATTSTSTKPLCPCSPPSGPAEGRPRRPGVRKGRPAGTLCGPSGPGAAYLARRATHGPTQGAHPPPTRSAPVVPPRQPLGPEHTTPSQRCKPPGDTPPSDEDLARAREAISILDDAMNGLISPPAPMTANPRPPVHPSPAAGPRTLLPRRHDLRPDGRGRMAQRDPPSRRNPGILHPTGSAWRLPPPRPRHRARRPARRLPARTPRRRPHRPPHPAVSPSPPRPPPPGPHCPHTTTYPGHLRRRRIAGS